MRPSVSFPTGTVIGPPVSRTSVPRARPSVASIATARTRSSPRCCCTSSTSVAGLVLVLLVAVALEVDLKRVVDLGQLVGERDLDHDPLDLLDGADVPVAVGLLLFCLRSSFHSSP